MRLWEWILSWFGQQKPPAPKPPSPPPPEPEPGPIAELLDAINEVRADHGKPPLRDDAVCENLAQGWAEKMDLWNVETHGDFDGRFKAFYPNRFGAENIAENYLGAEAVVTGWMASPGHRQNILGDYSHAGCGRSGNYWCVVFALMGS